MTIHLSEIIIITLFSNILLVLIFAFLYAQYRERHLLFWTLAWFCHSLRILFDYFKQSVQPEGLLEHLVQGSALLAGLLLLLGTARFVRKPAPRSWLILAGVLFAWDVAVHLLGLPSELGGVPIFLFHGVMTLRTGWLLIREEGGPPAGRIAGWALILWGVHKLDYPLLRDHPALAGWGFLLGAFFALTVALCMLLAYFQKVRNLLRSGREQLQSVLDHVDNAVMALDSAYRVTFYNQRYLELWRVTPQFLDARPTIGEVIEEVCRIGLYPASEAGALIARRMAQLEGAEQKVVLETPRLDGSMVEGFAAQLPDGGYLLTFRDVTRRKRAEEELERSREHLRSLVETVPHGILECDQRGTVTFVNPAYVQMQRNIHGGELVGSSIFDLIGDDESREEVRAIFLRRLGEGRGQGTELVRNRDRDGKILWRQLDWTLRRNDAGEAEGFIAVVTDVTERRRDEEQVLTTHVALRRILQDAPLAIAALDENGVISVWNRAAERLFGWRPDEVIGGGLDFLQMPEDQQQLFSHLLLAAGAGETLRQELTIVPRQGGTLDVAISAGPLATIDGPAGEVVLVIEDISEQRRIELALRHSEETYRNLVNNAPVAIFVHIEGLLVFLNPAAVELLGGGSAEQLEGRSVDEFLVEEQRESFRRRIAQSARDGRRVNRLRLQIAPLNGGVREVDATFLGVEYSGCEARMALCLDVTERNRSERELRAQAEFMQTILDTIPAPIFYMGKSGAYLGCNRAFLELAGMPRAEIIGRDVFSVAPPQLAAGIHRSNQELLERGGTQTYETEMVLRPGEVREVLLTKAVFYDENLTPAGLVGTMIDISERKRAEEALRESERKYRAIFDQAFQFSSLLDPSGKVLAANRSSLDFINAVERDVLGQFFWETPWWKPYPELIERLRVAIEQASDGEPARFEAINRGIRNEERWIDFSLKPVRDDWGQIVFLVAEGRDITVRKRSEELTLLVARGVSAETGEGFFRSLTRYLARALGADYAFVGELDGEQVRVVAGVEHDRDLLPFVYALADTPCGDVTAGGVACSWAQNVAAAFPKDQMLRDLHIDGYAGSPLLDSAGRPQGILVVLFSGPIKDAAQVETLLRIFASRAAAELERRRAEQVLEESEARYRQLSHEFETIFNGIPDSLTVWTVDLRLVWANRATQEFYDTPFEELANATCDELCRMGCCVETDCEVRRCFKARLAEDLVRSTPDGRSWGIKTFPLLDENGKLTRVIRLASDISERVRLREEAARASHLAALGELAAGVAHEINNPTGLILLDLPIIRAAFHDCLPILEQQFEAHGDFELAGLDYALLRTQLPPLLDEVLDGAQRIKQIVDELKDFARPFDPHQFTPVDLCEVVRKASQLVGSQLKKATDRFEVREGEGARPVAGNAQRLEQVVINLLLNACQALPARDCAIVVTIGNVAGAGRNYIEVRDEGIGIRPEHLAQVTDPFFTTRRESGGTGLGLSVSSRIVEEHGGSMQITSRPGEGTTVTLSFPELIQEKSDG